MRKCCFTVGLPTFLSEMSLFLAARCQGQHSSISVSSEKLRNVRIPTIPARRATLWKVSGAVMVEMMSAPTRSSRPSRMTRPRFDRYCRMRIASRLYGVRPG